MKKLLLFLVFIPCLLQAQSYQELLEDTAYQRQIHESIAAHQKNHLPVRNNFNTIKLNLLPDSMQQYIGKVTRKQFEKVVGSMIDYNDATKTYSYAIINSNVSGDDTTIQCFYRESDNMLISVMFPTKYYLTYWIGFQHLKGFPKTQAEMERLGVRIIK